MIATMSWQSAIVWVAVLICFVGIPILVNGRKRSPADVVFQHRLGEQQAEVLAEVRAVRDELASLRTQVDELDRVLKSVE